jgi:hypothetical protein
MARTGSMGDRLLNKLVERAQLWAEVKDDDSIDDGKVIMRKRKSFLEARKETFDYVLGLERTILEMDQQLDTKRLSVPDYVRQMTDAELERLGLVRNARGPV